MALLEANDIHTYYGSIHALKGITLSVEKGEIVTLIGGNGAGKTTTLNTICGVYHPRTGSILLEGEPIHQLPAHAIVGRGVAHSPEGRRVFGRLSVAENLEMGAFSRKDKARHQTRPGMGLHALPPLEGAPKAACRHPLRRRAADAGHG